MDQYPDSVRLLSRKPSAFIPMVMSVAALAFFVFRWLPRVPRQTLHVLALQIGVALAAMAPVYFLGL